MKVGSARGKGVDTSRSRTHIQMLQPHALNAVEPEPRSFPTLNRNLHDATIFYRRRLDMHAIHCKLAVLPDTPSSSSPVYAQCDKCLGATCTRPWNLQRCPCRSPSTISDAFIYADVQDQLSSGDQSRMRYAEISQASGRKVLSPGVTGRMQLA